MGLLNSNLCCHTTNNDSKTHNFNDEKVIISKLIIGLKD